MTEAHAGLAGLEVGAPTAAQDCPAVAERLALAERGKPPANPDPGTGNQLRRRLEHPL